MQFLRVFFFFFFFFFLNKMLKSKYELIKEQQFFFSYRNFILLILGRFHEYYMEIRNLHYKYDTKTFLEYSLLCLLVITYLKGLIFFLSKCFISLPRRAMNSLLKLSMIIHPLVA